MRKNKWLKRNLVGLLCLMLVFCQGSNRITTVAADDTKDSSEDSSENNNDDSGEGLSEEEKQYKEESDLEDDDQNIEITDPEAKEIDEISGEESVDADEDAITTLSVEEEVSEDPRVYDEDYIYFDLTLGNVTITDSEWSGYVYVYTKAADAEGTTQAGYQATKVTYTTDTTPSITGKSIYVYQSNGAPGTGNWEDGLPVYSRVGAPSSYTGGDRTGDNQITWADYIINNQDVEAVITNWGTQSTNSGHIATGNYIDIQGSGVNITIDNLYSSYQATGLYNKNSGIRYTPITGGCTTISLIGDNRFGNILYGMSKNLSAKLIFQDASETKDATLTVAEFGKDSEDYNKGNAVIGGVDNVDHQEVYGLCFEGGIIYAGSRKLGTCTAIGGGGNGFGEVTISGGIVTAVSYSTGATIGGGSGLTSKGGEGNVTIEGGTVYAYNFGRINYDIPVAAIGGGSANSAVGAGATIAITGGTVYAQSSGGTAIGGGSSAQQDGGDVTLSISGNANVTAISIPNENSTSQSAGAGIGGGIGGTAGNGGSANVTISGYATVTTGSIGGGSTKGDTSKYRSGSATVKIEGNPTIQGQIVMETSGSGAGTCTFEMSGGTIDNSGIADYNPLRENGGALYIKNGTATITGGTIKNCTAKDGGAIYISNASTIDGDVLTMSGGTLENNTATGSGGAICIVTEDEDANSSGATVVIGDKNHEESHTCPVIRNNTAGKGGGIYLQNGTVTMYCGTIGGNTDSSGFTKDDITQVAGALYRYGGTIESKVAEGGTSLEGSENSDSYVYYTLRYYKDSTDGTLSQDFTLAVEQSSSGDTAAEKDTDITLSKTLFTKEGYYITGYKVGSTEFLFDYTEDSAFDNEENSVSTTKASADPMTLSILKTAAGISRDNESTTEQNGNGSKSAPYIIELYTLWAEEANGNTADFLVTIPVDVTLTDADFKSLGEDSNQKQANIGEVSATLKGFKTTDYLTIAVSSQNSGLIIAGGDKVIPVTYLFVDCEDATAKDLVTTADDDDSWWYNVTLAKKSGDTADSSSWKKTLEATIDGNNVKYAGTYTDTLTFTVRFNGQ
jgi:hypothetical protein